MFKRSIFLFMIIFLAVIQTSCGPSAISFYDVIHIARIDTVLNEDGKGRNIFFLVVPAGADCKLVDLIPALENLDKPNLSVAKYLDEQYRGYL